MTDTRYSDAHLTPPSAEYDAEYGQQLGRLFTNLIALDLALRIALYLQETPREKWAPRTFRLANLNVGDEIEESWLCRWAYLSEAVRAFNELQLAADRPQIDAGIVDPRNALAHGSIISEESAKPTVIIRFSRASQGKCRVTEKHVMTIEWLKAQTHRVFVAVQIVHDRLWELQQGE
jgi:hypothetical protein